MKHLWVRVYNSTLKKRETQDTYHHKKSQVTISDNNLLYKRKGINEYDNVLN